MKSTNDYIAYVDTDSLFLKIQDFLFDNKVSKEGWESLPDEEKIPFILECSAIIGEYVNDRAYEETQVMEYNSQVKRDDFSINFKQEIVCKSALFITKKKYGYHVVNKDHMPCDDIDVTGLEIIRSETPSAFREALKELLSMILKNHSDKDIFDTYIKHKQSSRESHAEEISENKGVKGLDKYIKNGEPIKGTPYHVKAVASYHRLLKELGLNGLYPEIEEDTKNKLVYVKPNPYNIQCIMYDRWPSEFDKFGVIPDYEKMIDKFLTQKLLMLLEPAGRGHIINQNQSFNAFFGGM